MKTTFRLGAALLLVLAAGVSSGQSDKVRVGRKTIDLASIEGDGLCTQMVAPYDLSGNFAELFGIAAMEGVKSLPNIFRGAAASPDGHKLSEPVRAAAVRMNWLPLKLEVAYGEYNLGLLRDSGQLLERSADPQAYAKAEALLADELQNVTESHPYTFQVYVRKSNDDNAMALPGGFIFLDASLLDDRKRNLASLALSHEIAHVLRRHETRALQARIVDALSLAGGASDMISTLTDVTRGSTDILKLVVTGKLQFERHKVDQELQADACGVRLTQRVFSDDSRLLAALREFLASLPPPMKEDDPNYRAATSLKLEEVSAIVDRPVDRHPSTGQRQALFNAVLKDLADAGVNPPRVAATPAPGSAATNATRPRSPARDANGKANPPAR